MKSMRRKRLAGIAAGLMLLVSLAGCGAGEGKADYPLTVDGTAITLDTTTMKEIYDAGFEVSVLDTTIGAMQWYEIEADMPLDADSVYTGLYIGKNGERYASLSVVTEEACTVGESVVYALTSTESGLGKITFSAVPLPDLTKEKALEIEKNLEEADYGQSRITDDMILRIKRDDSTGAVTELEVEVRYDIDYSGS